jgi:MoaA/NifB/PqqE/SkfB family radical SAM enzyme
MPIEAKPAQGFVPNAPLYINWNYNYLCNFNCKHCYSRADTYPPELDETNLRRIATLLVDLGVFAVYLGGGEPLLRADVFDTIRILANGGVQNGLTTNAWWSSPSTAVKLKEAGLSELHVSLDSPSEEVHDSFRQHKGSYRRVLEALQLSVDAGLVVYLSTVVCSINKYHLEDLVGLGERFGVAGVHFKRFRPAGNGITNASSLGLSGKEMLQVADVMRTIKKTASIEVNFQLGSDPSLSDERCPCGLTSLCVRPNGDISPCVYSDLVVGNILRDDLADLWLTSPAFENIRKTSCCSFQSQPEHVSQVSTNGESQCLTRPLIVLSS